MYNDLQNMSSSTAPSMNAHARQPYRYDTLTNVPQPHAPQPHPHQPFYNSAPPSQPFYYGDFLPNTNPLQVPQHHPHRSYSKLNDYEDYESRFPLKQQLQVQPSGCGGSRDNIDSSFRGFDVSRSMTRDAGAANEILQTQGRMMYAYGNIGQEWHQQTPVPQLLHNAPSSSFHFNSPPGYPVWPGLMENPGVGDATRSTSSAQDPIPISSPPTPQTPMPSTLSTKPAKAKKEKMTLPPPLPLAPSSKGMFSIHKPSRASQKFVNTPSEALHIQERAVRHHERKESSLFAKQAARLRERERLEEEKGIPVPMPAASKKGSKSGGKKRKAIEMDSPVQLTFIEPISSAEGLKAQGKKNGGKRRKVEKINQAPTVGDVANVATSGSIPSQAISLQENDIAYQTETQDLSSDFQNVDQIDFFDQLFTGPLFQPAYHDSTIVPTSSTASSSSHRSTPSLASSSSSRSASTSISPPTPLFNYFPDEFNLGDIDWSGMLPQEPGIGQQ